MAKYLAWWSFEESNVWIFFTKELHLLCLGNKRRVHSAYGERRGSSIKENINEKQLFCGYSLKLRLITGDVLKGLQKSWNTELRGI